MRGQIMSKLNGRVALITGAGRGQGRSHALRLAAEGADIIAIDICHDIDTVTYSLSSADDLAQTQKEVEALDRRIVTAQADVRDRAALEVAVAEGIAAFGGIDIVIANAGIMPAIAGEEDDRTFADVIGVNLIGVRNTVEAVKATLIAQGRGGAIVLTSSSAGLRGYAGAIPGTGYVAAKHGVVGLMRRYALSLAPHLIRVNSIHPGGVTTPMVTNDALIALMTAHQETLDDYKNAMPVDHLEPVDISNAVLWLVSDEARYVTGVTLPIDAGHSVR